MLADFERGAANSFAMRPQEYARRFGPKRFWETLAATPAFFERLELMEGARELYAAVAHLQPMILTGLPGTWADLQKRRWAARHFPDVEVITTLEAWKHRYCQAGDVLVDDRDVYAAEWERAGGIFVRHLDSPSTISALRALGLPLSEGNQAGRENWLLVAPNPFPVTHRSEEGGPDSGYFSQDRTLGAGALRLGRGRARGAVPLANMLEPGPTSDVALHHGHGSDDAGPPMRRAISLGDDG